MDGISAVYRELPPPAHLAGWVAYFWTFRAKGAPDQADASHLIPPEAGITLTLLPGAEGEVPPMVVSGPHRRAVEVPSHPGRTVAGVRFLPATSAPLVAIPAEELRDGVFPARVVLPELATVIEPLAAALLAAAAEAPAAFVQLFADALAPLAPAPHRLDQTVVRSVLALLRDEDPPTVAGLAAAADLSPRQFRRRFRRTVGLSPREVRAIRRLRSTLVSAVTGDAAAWACLAAEHGYADQAHLCRDFRSTSGRSPENYRRTVAHIDHRDLHDAP